MDSLPLKMPVISGYIGVCALAEPYRNRLAFDDTEFYFIFHLFEAPVYAGAFAFRYFSRSRTRLMAIPRPVIPCADIIIAAAGASGLMPFRPPLP